MVYCVRDKQTSPSHLAHINECSAICAWREVGIPIGIHTHPLVFTGVIYVYT